MIAALVLWEALCTAGFALSVKSIIVLRARSPYTLAGWIFTAGYLAVAGYDALARVHAPFHADWVLVALLTLAFIVAGVRKEPQAVPWWWPDRDDASAAPR